MIGFDQFENVWSLQLLIVNAAGRNDIRYLELEPNENGDIIIPPKKHKRPGRLGVCSEGLNKHFTRNCFWYLARCDKQSVLQPYKNKFWTQILTPNKIPAYLKICIWIFETIFEIWNRDLKTIKFKPENWRLKTQNLLNFNLYFQTDAKTAASQIINKSTCQHSNYIVIPPWLSFLEPKWLRSHFGSKKGYPCG